MKILDLRRNDFGQIIALVLDCNKERIVSAYSLDGLTRGIVKDCHFATAEDVAMDLSLNYADFT